MRSYHEKTKKSDLPMTEKITPQLKSDLLVEHSATETFSPSRQSIDFLMAFAAAYSVEKTDCGVVCDFIMN